uniref:Uncharacterized protein n=1 Tax=Glossina palpalis gambiensis TaxID=67801 RepID=A0A1B0AVY8_9MUSC
MKEAGKETKMRLVTGYIFIINYNSNYQVFKKLIKLKSANASSQLALNVAICNQGLNQTCGYNRHCDNDQFLTKFKYTVISKHQYVPPQRPTSSSINRNITILMPPLVKLQPV